MALATKVACMFDASRNVIEHFPVATSAHSHAQLTVLLAQNAAATPASTANALSSAMSHVHPAWRSVNGGALISDVRPHVGKVASVQCATSLAQRGYDVAILVLGSVVRNVHFSVVSATKRRFRRYSLAQRMSQKQGSSSYKTATTFLKSPVLTSG